MLKMFANYFFCPAVIGILNIQKIHDITAGQKE